MSGYAILRFEKIKSIGDLKRLAAHHERTGSEVSNAKPPYDSRIFAGSGDMTSDVISRLPDKHRSDAVLAIEFMLTTSPESQRVDGEITAKWDKVKVKQFTDAAQAFLQKEFGGTATARVHFDEKTPHVQGFVVPNEDWVSGGKLNAKKLFSPITLVEFQTRWFETCVKAGLEVKRGELGSQAEHEPIARYYGRVNAPIPLPPGLKKPPPEATSTEKIKESIGIETDHSKAVEARKKSELARLDFLEKNYKRAMQNASESAASEKSALERALKAEAKFAIAKKQTDDLRALPLSDVLLMLGCEPHKTEKLRWSTPAGDVWIEKNGGPRFNSFEGSEIKGRGAVDLVMKVNASTFAQATAYLASHYGVDATVRDAAGMLAASAPKLVKKALQAASEPSALPNPYPEHIQRVSTYLTKVRGIPAALVASLVQAGRIYADKFANAVFLTDDRAGCEIRGTGSTVFHGQRGPKTGYTVPGDPKKVVLVESAIEAMSCNAMTGHTAISMGGANLVRASEIARAWIAKGAAVFAGQNADKDGDKQASSLIAKASKVHRLKPQFGASDWNDALRISQEKESHLQLSVSNEEEQENAVSHSSTNRLKGP